MIAVIDYGIGNTGSVVNMFKRIGVRAAVEADPRNVSSASGIILPGVGAFDAAMQQLKKTGMDKAVEDAVFGKSIPVLGICLGMQLLGTQSEEGSEQGLGWIPATIERIPEAPGLKIPHMGWNLVDANQESQLGRDLAVDTRYYFVHKFHMVPEDSSAVSMWCNHGIQFAAAVESGNVYGVQFHPEKSHKYGMNLLSKFSELTC